MEINEQLLPIAKGCAYNDRFEADAVQKYTELLETILQSPLSQEDKDELVAKISEIISDELNHEEVLKEIYVKLTGIEPNKD